MFMLSSTLYFNTEISVVDIDIVIKHVVSFVSILEMSLEEHLQNEAPS